MMQKNNALFAWYQSIGGKLDFDDFKARMYQKTMILEPDADFLSRMAKLPPNPLSDGTFTVKEIEMKPLSKGIWEFSVSLIGKSTSMKTTRGSGGKYTHTINFDCQ